MRSIVQIIEDDKKGKQLSQTERQIAGAYIQGKYDAVMELKIGNNSNTDDVLDKLRAEIAQVADEAQKHDEKWAAGLRYAVKIIDQYREVRMRNGKKEVQQPKV